MYESPDYRDRILARYVSTHKSVSGAAAGLESRRPFLDKFVADHFPPDRQAAILDLGCGHGAVLWAAQRAGYANIAGVDASPEQVAASKELGIHGVRQGDLLESLATAADASLDAIVLFDLYHYFSRGQQMWIADQVLRILKPGGRFLLHVPNGEAPFASRMRYWDFLADFSYTRASLGQLLGTAGFVNVECFEDRPVVHGLKSAVRALLWRCVRLACRLALAAETGETGREAVFSQVMTCVAIKGA